MKPPKAPPAAPTAPIPPQDLQKGIERARVSMGEALRRSGVDEIAVAEHLAETIKKLSDRNETGDGVEKLFVDVLKECTRHLDSPRSPSASPAASDSPVVVHLIHSVARPVRPPAIASSGSPATTPEIV